MHIQPVAQNNNTNKNVNFGVNFVNKPQWNKELLNTLEKSNLVKSIDEKYPDAFIKYSKHDVTGVDLANDEPNYLASLVFGLDSRNVTAYNINSHTSEGADRALNAYMRGVSLADVEKRAAETDGKVSYTVSILPVKNAKKPSFFKRVLAKFLGSEG